MILFLKISLQPSVFRLFSFIADEYLSDQHPSMGAGKYEIRASHPDLKIEIRGSPKVRCSSFFPYIVLCLAFCVVFSSLAFPLLSMPTLLYDATIFFFSYHRILLLLITFHKFIQHSCGNGIILAGECGVWKWRS